MGGVSLILYGLIALMGVKIWLDAKVDFSAHRNLVVAGASIIVATGLGVKGVTIGNLNLAGIAVGTLLAMVLNLILSLRRGGVEPLGESSRCIGLTGERRLVLSGRPRPLLPAALFAERFQCVHAKLCLGTPE